MCFQVIYCEKKAILDEDRGRNEMKIKVFWIESIAGEKDDIGGLTKQMEKECWTLGCNGHTDISVGSMMHWVQKLMEGRRDEICGSSNEGKDNLFKLGIL